MFENLAAEGEVQAECLERRRKNRLNKSICQAIDLLWHEIEKDRDFMVSKVRTLRHSDDPFLVLERPIVCLLGSVSTDCIDTGKGNNPGTSTGNGTGALE